MRFHKKVKGVSFGSLVNHGLTSVKHYTSLTQKEGQVWNEKKKKRET